MPHDVAGNVLKEGDVIMLPARVIGVQPASETCNITVECINKGFGGWANPSRYTFTAGEVVLIFDSPNAVEAMMAHCAVEEPELVTRTTT